MSKKKVIQCRSVEDDIAPFIHATHVLYEALIKKGFNTVQAFELTKLVIQISNK